jgi:hypothetical protein
MSSACENLIVQRNRAADELAVLQDALYASNRNGASQEEIKNLRGQVRQGLARREKSSTEGAS